MGSKALIIGAGLAGLSAGCYLQLNGYETEIFEAHDKPGGLCTGWTRKGYNIDGCIHGLLGSSSSHPFYHMWDELLPMAEINFINYDEVYVFDYEDGHQFTVHSDLDRFEEYMLELSPGDEKPIKEYINGTRYLSGLDMSFMLKPRELYGITDYIGMVKLLPVLNFMNKWNKVSSEDFAERFTDPNLKRAISNFMSPILFQMLIHLSMNSKVSGYPAIGSLGLSRLLAEKYIETGGVLHTLSKVRGIYVEKDTAIGIQLEDGSKLGGDKIISAIDMHATLYGLLQGDYVDERTETGMDSMKLNSSRIQVSIGVEKELEDIPHSMKIILEDPITIGDELHAYIDVLTYTQETDAAPPGKTLFIIQLETRNYDYWIDLRANDRQAYNMTKTGVADSIITLLDHRLGQIKENVEMVDISTPATYLRYTGNWKGSIQGWDNDNLFQANPFRKELKGLRNFYMTGHWVEPGGGVPNAYKSGRDLAQIICKRDKIPFNPTGK